MCTSDVDVLIVYDGQQAPSALKEALYSVPLPGPLDLLCLSREEDLELSFVATENAVLLWSASRSSGRGQPAGRNPSPVASESITLGTSRPVGTQAPGIERAERSGINGLNK